MVKCGIRPTGFEKPQGSQKGAPLNKRSLPTLALVLIMLLAATLRFWRLDACEFKYDEARVCNLAARFVDTSIPPVRGMGSSIGIDNPPLTVYLMSLPALFSRDPLIATGFVALLNVICPGNHCRLRTMSW